MEALRRWRRSDDGKIVPKGNEVWAMFLYGKLDPNPGKEILLHIFA